MTLEEIERESVKLSAGDRGKLAARLLSDLEEPDSAEASAEASGSVCPACRKPTKCIQIEEETTDWARTQLLGSLTAVHPDKERAKVCEHCGHVFDRQLLTNPVTDRIVDLMFYGIPAIGMIWLLVRVVTHW
ncbi:MAG TPA: hypothetical protein VGE67_15495 [Haloferula sp.]